MGCTQVFRTRKLNQHLQCIEKLNQVESLLEEMTKKYEREEQRLTSSIKQNIRSNSTRSVLLQQLRKRKVVSFYMKRCQDRCYEITQRRYAVEQLNLTTMQVEALQSVASTMKSFNKKYTTDRIEKLNDTMIDLTDQIMDVNEILNQPLTDLDEDELLEELNGLIQTTPEKHDVVSTTVVFPTLEEVCEISQEKTPLLVEA